MKHVNNSNMITCFSNLNNSAFNNGFYHGKMSYLFKSIDVHSPKLPLEDSGLFIFLYHEAQIKSKGFQAEKR